MLSPEYLSANIAALTQTQGRCPSLGALPQSVRVAVAGHDVHVEARMRNDEWQPLDLPSTAHNAAAWLERGTAPGAAQVVLVGAGLGYALPALAARGISRIVAIEPYPGVATLLLSRADWQAWIADGRLRLLTGPEYTGAADVARCLDGLRDISVVTHPLREAAEPSLVEQARTVATRIVQNAHANGNARRKFAGGYLLQTLANLEAIGESADIAALDGAFAGQPAVVVGAGPSLDVNGPQLAALQDRAVIITADTALRPLHLHGVRPHLAVSVDSSALNARHLTAAPGGDVYLAAEGSVHPTGLAPFAGRTFAFRVSNHEPWPWLRTGGVDRAEVATWGSVLTSALGIARRLGCDPIVFAGADLAYTDMRPYCRGTIYDAMWQEWIDRGCTWDALMTDYFSRQPEVWRPDVRGIETRTAPHLLSFRDWLVEQTTTTRDRVFINATGAGLLHGGRLQQASLDDVLRGAPRLPDPRVVLAECHAACTYAQDDGRRIARLLDGARTRPASLPLGTWREFTAATVSEGQILEAVGAGVGVGVTVR